MLWRVRTTLPDRPGALALLAEQCGLAEINILGLQIFPGVEAVTDELVLRAPDEWDPDRLAALVEAVRRYGVRALPCTEAALTDQPTRYVRAARAIVDRPMSFPEVVARLFDAEAEPAAAGDEAGFDVMELTVGDVQVQIRRTTAFTATEHARGAAIAELVSDVLARAPGEAPRPTDGRPTYVVTGERVTAVVDGVAVGVATLAGRLCGRIQAAHDRGRPRLAAARGRDPPPPRRGTARPDARCGRAGAGHRVRQRRRPADGARRRAARPDQDGRRRAHRAGAGARPAPTPGLD